MVSQISVSLIILNFDWCLYVVAIACVEKQRKNCKKNMFGGKSGEMQIWSDCCCCSHFSIQEGGWPSLAFAWHTFYIMLIIGVQITKKIVHNLVQNFPQNIIILRDQMRETKRRTLMANCFMVASSAVWLPEKYPATALWKRRSCFCITWTHW